MQIPEEIRKCVFFILYRSKAGYIPAGTGFFTSMPFDNDPSRLFVYLVTAKHVIIEASRSCSDGNVWLRINTRDTMQLIPTSTASWKFFLRTLQ
jgi:hypothetical protein